MDDEECEAIARWVHDDSGLDDRPLVDPSVLAVCWAGLRVRPESSGRPRLEDGVIVYPAGAPPDAVAYFVAHELAHEVLAYLEKRLRPDEEERAASRIGSAVILPRRPVLRDLRAEGWDLARVHELWPLASWWLLARRVTEILPATASEWHRSGRCARRVGHGQDERSAAQAAIERGTQAAAGTALAWPTPNGAIAITLVR